MARKYCYRDAVRLLRVWGNSGSSCSYISLGYYGIKCYVRDKKNRDYAYKTQQKLHKLGLAPAVSGRFTMKFSGKNMYCYLTRHAHTTTRASVKELVELRKKLVSLGYKHTSDVVDRNVGYVDGKLVLIDCDFHTI